MSSAQAARQAPETSRPRRRPSPRSRRWSHGDFCGHQAGEADADAGQGYPGDGVGEAGYLRPVRHQFGAAAHGQQLVDQRASGEAGQHHTERLQQGRLAR
jgi:hypothetical protein